MSAHKGGSVLLALLEADDPLAEQARALLRVMLAGKLEHGVASAAKATGCSKASVLAAAQRLEIDVLPTKE